MELNRNLFLLPHQVIQLQVVPEPHSMSPVLNHQSPLSSRFIIWKKQGSSKEHSLSWKANNLSAVKKFVWSEIFIVFTDARSWNLSRAR